MDYHLDWIYAALVLDSAGKQATNEAMVFESPNFAESGRPPVYINTNQEDIDLLVACKPKGVTHLILVEAKGATGWTNKQIRSKAARLKIIFDSHVSWFHDDVIPHFVLASPRPPQHLAVEDWFPSWMAPQGMIPWVRLDIGDRVSAVRCDPATCEPDSNSHYWRLR